MEATGAPSSAGVLTTAATTGSVHFLMPLSLRSSASTVPSVAPVHSPANQLLSISKFKGEDPNKGGGKFEEWIEQFKLIAEGYMAGIQKLDLSI